MCLQQFDTHSVPQPFLFYSCIEITGLKIGRSIVILIYSSIVSYMAENFHQIRDYLIIMFGCCKRKTIIQIIYVILNKYSAEDIILLQIFEFQLLMHFILRTAQSKAISFRTNNSQNPLSHELTIEDKSFDNKKVQSIKMQNI